VRIRFSIKEIFLFRAEVRLRLPFRFRVVTLTQAPQASCARHRPRGRQGGRGRGGGNAGAKWFDKDPALRQRAEHRSAGASLALARDAYLAAARTPRSAIGSTTTVRKSRSGHARHEQPHACFGPCVIDRALLDALCRALGVSFYEAIRSNLPGISAPGWQADLAAFDIDEFLSQLSPAARIAARHTVGLRPADSC